MLKKTLKRVARKCGNVLKRLIEEPPTSIGPHDHWALPYTLNPIFVKLMEKEGCRCKYTWGAVQALNLAKNLGLGEVSLIEFGVAGGNSLLHLERLAAELEVVFGIHIDVYGFDTGTGLPPPQDYRDMPNLWSEGYFPMDVEKLRKRLTRAKLILGPVENTVADFLEIKPAPISCVAFDVDYYSSTTAALKLFDAGQSLLLPRIYCYFGSVEGWTCCEFNGARLAIADFNATHAMRKIAAIAGIRYYVPQRFFDFMPWENYYMLHIFDHEFYARNDRTIARHCCTLRD